MKIESEIGRAALIFIGSVAAVHLGYLWEFLLKLIGGGNDSAWLALLLLQLVVYAAYGTLLAWTRWARAEWYMTASFIFIGLVYYFSTGYQQFAYISAALWYGLFVSAISNWGASKFFPRPTAAD